MQLSKAGQCHGPNSKLLKNCPWRVTVDCRPLDLQIWIRETNICGGQWKTEFTWIIYTPYKSWKTIFIGKQSIFQHKELLWVSRNIIWRCEANSETGGWHLWDSPMKYGQVKLQWEKGLWTFQVIVGFIRGQSPVTGPILREMVCGTQCILLYYSQGNVCTQP
jgi:hypothetical protein